MVLLEHILFRNCLPLVQSNSVVEKEAVLATDTHSLEQIIHQATRIHTTALQGSVLSQFSMNEKFV
jgi:hypothetical protein